ncbi:SGNH/GDSL hydrolase family protein [Helicobacter sp. MIT 21-1697]|uniref:SGNH/GDSL hydrolase family protein n=1 Tax=Helicobacter sp. MIT 21-1697 TaxID=2993733 RepID=UPI00224B55C9|nr:SGNH/GDSL hydrolase family protein [Helicobacter sp. MIT 21-1697]MCX2717720.1 SGNH/GDSL hydrolase family protein [Helicobacter sp. MIT 21-1697]
MRIWSIGVGLCISLCLLQGADYPLKAIAKELGESKQAQKPSIIPQSKKLLESTSGIINYQQQAPKEFITKFKKKENLIIRIFGDSHIAGDFISHRLRGLLFKNHSIGFVYPLYPHYHQNIALKYESNNFEILNSRLHELDEYPMGGVVAKPVELPAHITLTPQTQFTQEEILSKIIFKAPNKEKAIIIEDAKNQRFIINAKRPFIWQILSLKLHYPITIRALNEKVLFGGFFIYEQQGVNNIVENLGINGARSDIWLKWDKPLLKQQMSLLPADLVVLCYGSNDALYDNFNESIFLKNYSEFIDLIRQSNPQASILLISPPPVVQKVSPKKRKKAVYKKTKNASAVKAAIAKLAKQKQTMLFDLEDFINQSGGKKKWEEANLAKADVHLLPNGYKLVADKLYYELNKLKQ